MNREYKFRGRNITTGEWVYGCILNNLWIYSENHPLRGSPVCEIIVTGEATDWEAAEDLKITVDPKTVGQLTGLQDKNGKDIYEGDIISCGKTKTGTLIAWLVVFHFDGWKLGGGKGTPSRPNKSFWARNVVIGNIYENPELINPQ